MRRLLVAWLCISFLASTLAPFSSQAQVITGSGSSSDSSGSSSGDTSGSGGSTSGDSSTSGSGSSSSSSSSSDSGSSNSGSYILLAAVIAVLIGVGIAADMHNDSVMLKKSKRDPVALVLRDEDMSDGIYSDDARDIMAGLAYHTEL